MGIVVVGGNNEGGSGGMMAIVLLVIVGLFIWMWRSGGLQGIQGQPQQPGGPTIFTIPGSPAAPAAPAAAPQQPQAPGILPPVPSCNCTTNASCNAFCSSTSMFNLCCFGTNTAPTTPAEELPDPNPSLCSSQFKGSCNVECSDGTEEECIECNAICDENVAYSGDTPLEEEEVTAGAAQPTCPTGYAYDVNNNLCVPGAAPVYPTTPISPPLSTYRRDEPRCKSVFDGSCSKECSSGPQALCNDCMVTCGEATAGAANVGGTSGGSSSSGTCKSKYNGSCSSECSGGSNSTCNACNAACGNSANIAKVRTASQARHLLNNRLYNSIRSQSYDTRHRRVGYDRQSRASGNFFRIGNLI